MDKLAEVPQIHDVSLLDVAGRLRKLADSIDAGEYKVIDTCAIVILYGDREMARLGFGPRSDHDSTSLALFAGAVRGAANLGA